MLLFNQLLLFSFSISSSLAAVVGCVVYLIWVWTMKFHDCLFSCNDACCFWFVLLLMPIWHKVLVGWGVLRFNWKLCSHVVHMYVWFFSFKIYHLSKTKHWNTNIFRRCNNCQDFVAVFFSCIFWTNLQYPMLWSIERSPDWFYLS